MVTATKNGETREFGQIQWRLLKAMPDGTHEGWREVTPGTTGNITFNPPEIAIPAVATEIPAPAPIVEQPVQSDEFSDINGPGAPVEQPVIPAPAAKASAKSGNKPGPKKSSK